MANRVSSDLIRIEESLFSRDRGGNWVALNEPDPEVVCADLDGRLRVLGLRVLRHVAGGKVPLPLLPRSAAMALEIATQRDASFRDYEVAIRDNPVMAAKLLKIANSPLYGAARAVTSIRQAMLLLGTNSLAQMVMQVVIESHAFGSEEDIQQLAREHTHAIAVAHICQAVALKIGQGSPEAFLCGLLHDFGNIVLPAILRAMGTDIEGDLRAPFFAALHPAIGYYVASSWQLPDIVLEAALCHHGAHRGQIAPNLGIPAAPSRIGDLIAAAEYFSARHGLGSGETLPWKGARGAAAAMDESSPQDPGESDAFAEAATLWQNLNLSESALSDLDLKAAALADKLTKTQDSASTD